MCTQGSNIAREIKKHRGLIIKILFTAVLALPATVEWVRAQEDLAVIDRWLHYSDASNALYHHLAGQAYDLLEQRNHSVRELQSLSEWQQRQELIRETLADIVGPFPEKTPLNPRITRTVEKDGYRIEHIVYESQPGFYVTSSLYFHDGIRGRAPAVIYCSGHSAPGYRSGTYQHVILNLVHKGFVVFAFDPVGQGERLEYYDPQTGKSRVGSSTREHSYPGSQAFISGSSQARYMIWDGIRAVDYILTRQEVDPARIGITGRSGGGTQSAYIAAFDQRIKAAAPECYITNFTRLFQSIGPQDAEQNLFRGIFSGIDHPDFLAVRAPAPALMITTTRDFFSIQGARETAAEVAGIYRFYGREGNFGMVEDDYGHESTKRNREAMYAFFQKHLDNPGDPTDQETVVPAGDELQVTPTGQVSTSYEGETVFSLNRKETEKLLLELNASRQDPERHLEAVAVSAGRLSGYIAPQEVRDPVYAGGIRMEDYRIEKYFVRGEGDYVIPYLLMIPPKPGPRALICLHPQGRETAIREGGEAEWFVRNGFTVLVPDMIGVGELGDGEFHGDASIDGVSHNLWYASMQIGRSITGIRAGDVIRLCSLLQQERGISVIYGLATGEMGPVLLHAAAFDGAIERVALIEPFTSYRSLVMNRFYKSAFIHSAVPGALEYYDLPDLAGSLAPRKLLIMGMTDGLGNKAGPDDILEDAGFIREAYRHRNAAGQLNIVTEETTGKEYELYMDWIR